MQSGGGVNTNDTSTLNYLCRYAWVYVQFILLFLRPPSPPSSPGHTLDLVRDEALGWGGRGSFVSSAYWKCTVGFFSCMGNHLCQAFPYFPYLSHLVSCLCVILFASCTKLIFSQSLKTELTWLGGCVFG
uniref:Uncharacterized protein n=1 Tax=Capra hircus TaxID=9925 RepID=A0A452FR64_CAPHI